MKLNETCFFDSALIKDIAKNPGKVMVATDLQ